MKKIKSLAMLLLGLSIAFTSCEKEPEPEPEPTPVSVTGITLDSSSLTLTEGETARLIATISPSNADNQGVIWSSSDASVASVSNGTVTAVSAGSAIITAKSDDGGKTATCDVTVNSKIIPVASISLDKSSLEFTKRGEEYALVATVLPENATDKSVVWSSDNDNVATVDNGKITAVGSGNATITVKTVDGNHTATCVVAVKIVVPEGAVDLGLSVFWATCNLGASNPEEFGNYYAWGETETKSDYSLNTYKFYKTEKSTDGEFEVEYKGYTKYVTEKDAEVYGFKGLYDNKTVLDPEDDVAHVLLGGKWRMPTEAEFKELENNCTWQWAEYKGAEGYKVTSNKSGYTDKWIFLPASHFIKGKKMDTVWNSGDYQSSSLARGSVSSWSGVCLSFLSGSISVGTSSNCGRYVGLTVRAVCE